MAAASQAAAEAGGRVVGLPMRGWHNVTPNRWNHELRWSDTYAERLAHLLAADAVVVLDGGIGTLSEAATVWAALQTEPDAADLVFLGAGWGPVLRALAAHLVIDERDLAHVTSCANPEAAAAHIAGARSRPRPAAQPRG
jgi:predicted Rossmann-fold nucleotide-binding protein